MKVSLKGDIKEEKEAVKHYDHRAKQLPKFKKDFHHLAKEEGGHAKRLQAIQKAKK